MKRILIATIALLSFSYAGKAQQKITLVNNRTCSVTFTIGGSCSPGPGGCSDVQKHVVPPSGASVPIPDFNAGLSFPTLMTSSGPCSCSLTSFLWHYADAQNNIGFFCTGAGMNVGDGKCSGTPASTFSTVTTDPPCVETYSLTWTVDPQPPFNITVTAD